MQWALEENAEDNLSEDMKKEKGAEMSQLLLIHFMALFHIP